MRRAGIATVIAAVAATGALVLLSSAGRDAARDAAAPFGLAEEAPFTIRMGGRLWQDRTIVGEDGARDVAAVASDERLVITVERRRDTRVAEVEVRIDGRPVRSTANRCRDCRTLRWSVLAPTGRLRPGDHAVEVIARDARAGRRQSAQGAHVAAARFEVRTETSLPRIVEGEPATRGASGSARATVPAATMRALDRERRTSLRALVGASRLRVAESGSISDGRRRAGVTLLLEVVPPRRDVAARLPAYVAGPGGRAGLQTVDARIAVLRDLLVNLEPGGRGLLTAEPGPRSVTTAWDAPEPPGTEDED